MIQMRVKRVARNKAWASGLLLAVLVATMMITAKPALAETFTVDRNDDPDPTTATACTAAANDCSLRGAIVAANANAGPDAVTVPAGTYTLTRAGANEDAASTGDLDVTDDLTITGAGARTTSVAGGAAPFDDRIFDIAEGASATITRLAITGGKPAGDAGGVNNRGDLMLDGVAVKNNTASNYGGILSNGSTLNLTDSAVSGNSATGDAGGVIQIGGTANITNSTVSGNRADRINGGVAAGGGALMNILNSTIVSNTSGRLGGGILTAGPLTLVTVKNTIVSGNTVNNCDTAQVSGGTISSQGNNVSSDASCGFTTSTDKQSTNPKLGPLANNGGPTDTRALLSGSPAIDAGANAGCPATDQRGVARPQGPRCDIGAFERPNSPPTARNNSYGGTEDRILKVPAQRGVLRNDTDPDGNALRATVVAKPKKGKLSLRPNGAFTYKPKKDFNGTVRFVYRASDGRGGTDRATVTLRIKARPG
ncbi:hypothetical protein BH24ACT20_BH24ACT20_02700 [soil metagenome]